MAATVTGVLLTGIHSARPSSGVSAGTLYSCTTHSLIYQTSDTGSTWATWANLAGTGGSGTVTTVKDEGSNLSTAVVSLDFVGAGVAATGTTAVTVTIPGGMTHSTLGTTSAGSSFATARGVYAKKVTLATAGLVASVHAFIKGNGANGVIPAAGIVSDSSGTPVSLIAMNNGGYPEAGGYNVSAGLSTTVRDFAMPMGTWLAAGDYWLVFGIGAGADSRIQLAYNAGTGTDRKYTTVSLFIADQSFQTYGSSDTNDYCIYADILR